MSHGRAIGKGWPIADSDFAGFLTGESGGAKSAARQSARLRLHANDTTLQEWIPIMKRLPASRMPLAEAGS